jgi:DNA helicase HerA-like ATPase
MKLFPKECVVGIFRGFSEGGLEFHADLILPYRNDFQSSPMHGQFVVVQLEHENEAVLGRITSMSSEGRLASGSGEDFGLRAVSEDRPIPEDLREQYLKYRINIRVLGVLRVVDGDVRFIASHRRLPHVGSKVSFLSDEVLREIAGHNIQGAELGFLALGEFIYAGGDKRLEVLPWMQVKKPAVIPKFPISNLVSRRSFVFARAGFGKSNLNKLLFSSLYHSTPTVEKRGGKRVPVGTVIFDPDGEYFWPDDKNRPGLCDVSHLEDKLVVFTSRKAPSPFYQSFVAGQIKLDIRRLRASDVVTIALSPEKQDQQNVRKLKALNDPSWRELVDEIYVSGNAADPDRLRELLHLESGQEMEVYAARANMTTIVRMLHDPGSQLMDMLLFALKNGKICVVDVSQLRGAPALVLSGLILQKIFDHNQVEFTSATPATIPTIAVVEEAQSVLSPSATSAEGPYVAWVKEGRKYDLGAVLITQQPGSISGEILSQGDNWFVFHLLSSGDLQSLKKANAHFSDDILSALLNEPIEGNGIHWSSAGGRGYPIPVRILSFENLYATRDPEYNKPPLDTFATKMLAEFEAATAVRSPVPEHRKEGTQLPLDVANEGVSESGESVDLLGKYTADAVANLRNDAKTVNLLKTQGVPWMAVLAVLERAFPPVIDRNERHQIAYSLVPQALDDIVGKDKWITEKRPKKQGPGLVTYVMLKKSGD